MKKLLIASIFFLCVMSANANLELRLMRYPDIAFGKIIFCYQGDLWLVGQTGGYARRLTVHPGIEAYPKFSPDGQWIAFTGNHAGGTDVFIIPSEGGQPKQLTYYPADDIVQGWTPDSKFVVFRSNRTSRPWWDELFKVSIEGTFPEKIPVDRGDLAAVSPDCSKIAYNRETAVEWWWKRYQGSMNREIWLYEFATRKFTQITDYPGNDLWPMWGDTALYFVSDRTDGIANIFACALDGKQLRQITHYSVDGVQWPSISPDRRYIVYEESGKLYVLDTNTEEALEVIVFAPSDDRFDLLEWIDVREYIQDFDIAEGSTQAVIEARGELFAVSLFDGKAKNLTCSPGSRDAQPACFQDSVAYISDQSGEEEIYLMRLDSSAPREQLTKNGKRKLGLQWSPDGKRILYHTYDRYLYCLDLQTKESMEVSYNPWTQIEDYTWSPDAQWVVYAASLPSGCRDLHIFSLTEKESFPLIVGQADEFSPVFMPDGRSLVYIARSDQECELRSVSLVPEKRDPYSKNQGEGLSVKGSTELRWALADIQNRVRSVPMAKGLYDGLQVTADAYYFLEITNQEELCLYSFSLGNLQRELLAENIKGFKVFGQGKAILTWDGKVFRLLQAGKGAEGRTLYLGELNLRLDRRAEWVQIFGEVWRLTRDCFYDQTLHGVDWQAVKERYQALLPYVQTRAELNLFLREMVGELNASHQSIAGGDQPKMKNFPVCLLGAEFAPDYQAGYYHLTKIYSGDKTDGQYHSPLDAEYIEIRPGDYLIAINGQEVSATENYLKYLVNQNREEIRLLTNRAPTNEGARETLIKPVTNHHFLRYKEWLDRNKQLVLENGAGRLGYIHLDHMHPPALKRFRSELEACLDKDGLIIDVRYNNGGYIEAELIDILARRPYQLERERDARARIRPDNAYAGKIVVLVNEFSYSDAELFACAVQARKLGIVIGKQSPGKMIASQAYQLIDNGHFALTQTALWTLADVRLEGRGVVPEIIIENCPEDELAGRDPQLERAISYLLQTIGDQPR